LAKIELWGKSATLVLIVTGVVLGLLYGWQMWEASSTAGLH
jgi:predicted negative regulator of RcsB-dependent stress response